MKRIDETGNVYGQWTVIKLAGKNNKGRLLWECQCQCGTRKNLVIDNLKRGSGKSCGCLQKEISKKPKTDEIGKKYGQLTIIEYAGRDKNRHHKWLCLCKCGNTKIILEQSLKRGLTKSCGCYRDKQIRKACRKYNKFIRYDKHVEVIFSNSRRAMIDNDDYQTISKYFCSIKSDNRIHVCINSNNLSLHRFIMQVDDPSLEVDHKDGNPLNNRKSNLRICTRQQNAKNRKRAINNTTGYKGVQFENGKYRARIRTGSKRICLGSFDNKEEAALAYNEAALLYHSEFARLNELP